MISLSIQIKLLIFSFAFGFFFSIILDIFNKKTLKLANRYKIVLSAILIIIMTVIYYIGIKKIGNSIFHIYSIISIIIGFTLYDLLIKLIANHNKK